MKPPVVHESVQPPHPSDADAEKAAVTRDANLPEQDAGSPGLVGSYGPLVGGAPAADQDGAGADERKKP